MSSHLESDYFSLRQRLESLLDEAQRNEALMRRFDRLERQLIGAGSLVELVSLLLCDYKLAFGLDAVSLVLIDKGNELRAILEGDAREEWPAGSLAVLASADAVTALYRGEIRPRLGVFDPVLHASLFEDAGRSIGSVALLPLARHNELIGSLHFGSADVARYREEYGTDFLERLSAVVAVCLDSTLSHERIKQMGLTDPLTGVHNRRYFEHRCAIEVSQARRYQRALSCMFVDVDRFKKINDTYGHPAGDEILRAVADCVSAQLRAGDTIARYGGEEFVVLLPQTDIRHALSIAERIRSSIERKLFYAPSGQAIKATISVGVARLALDDVDSADQPLASAMVAAADGALYRAKHAGRNRVECESDDGGAAAPGGAKAWPSRLWHAAAGMLGRVGEKLPLKAAQRRR